ncbi:hypothetical protein KPH14_009879 [Odynerus spinipes]|uniref:Uncharacterized protein n=1 Tax=Odynerus spinipes TaxID=1348599 RepID=A0AAD9VTZ7_9HYME|nr:hypothetical protein KPH14_009879 [Odynerus spinipes]
MKLVLLLALIALVSSQETIISKKAFENNEVEKQTATVLQAQPNSKEGEVNKKLTKRSFDWGPWGYGGGYGAYGWPWYGGWYGGWYPSWPWWYSGYGSHSGGYGGWYGGHGGWYKKW